MSKGSIAIVVVAAVGLLLGPGALESGRAARPAVTWPEVWSVPLFAAIGSLFVIGIQLLRRSRSGVRHALWAIGLASLFFVASGASAVELAVIRGTLDPGAILILATGVGAMVGVGVGIGVYRRVCNLTTSGSGRGAIVAAPSAHWMARAGRCGMASWPAAAQSVSLHMGQRATYTYGDIYNVVAGLVIVSETIAYVLGTDGGMASAGTAVLLVMASFPSCIPLLIFGLPLEVFPGSVAANGFITMALYFLAGWWQWHVLVPYIRRRITKNRDERNAG
jgi:hypothetical protein